MRSKKPTEKKLWKSIQIVMVEIRPRKPNSKNSMKPTEYSLMMRKKLTMIAMELWTIMDNEGDLVDFLRDSMLEISVIFSHHFLVVDLAMVAELRRRLISVRISRSDSVYLSRMRSEGRVARSSSTVLPHVITAVANEAKPRSVRLAKVKAK